MYTENKDPKSPISLPAKPPTKIGCFSLIWESATVAIIIHPPGDTIHSLVMFDMKSLNKTKIAVSSAIPSSRFLRFRCS